MCIMSSSHCNGGSVAIFTDFRFHFVSHTACSLHYTIDRYESDADVSKLNSRACEQLNAILVHLKPSLSCIVYVVAEFRSLLVNVIL